MTPEATGRAIFSWVCAIAAQDAAERIFEVKS